MIAGYYRVSTGRQEKEATIETQFAEVEKLASKNGDKIDFKYIDQNWSGTISWRPQLSKLREDVKSGKVTKIYAYDPDRIARGQELQIVLLGELEKNGAELYFVTQPNLSGLPEMARVSIKGIAAMVSEIERIKIRDRVIGGRLRKANEGHIVTGRAPYGFTYIEGDRKKGIHGYFKHNRDEIRIVKLILGLALEGASDNEIIAELFKRGIRTRNGSDKWQKSTIHKILSTNLSVYTGVWYYKKYRMAIPKSPIKEAKYKRTEKSSRILNDKDEWIKVELPKELAIITEEQAAKIRRLKRKNQAIKKHSSSKCFYLLQGAGYCESCGGLNYCDNFHGTPFYRCANKKRMFPHPPTCSSRGSIKSDALEKAVWSEIISLVTNPNLVKKELDRFIERNKTDTVINDSELGNILKSKVQAEMEKQRLNEAYTKGLFDDDDYLKEKLRIAGDLQKLEDEERDLLAIRSKSDNLTPESLNGNIDRLCEEVKEFLSDIDNENKRNALKWLGIKVLYNFPKHEYTIKGALPLYAKDFTQPFIHTGSVLHRESATIPFTIRGKLEKGGFPFAYI